MYKVKQGDLIGDIEGFPIEVVQRMVDCQVEQGYQANVNVFQRNNTNGFDWDKTKEGEYFWGNVIMIKDFDLFFRKYPKGKE